MEKENRAALPPHLQLIQMAGAFRVSRALYVAARLGLADQLAARPRSADDVAPSVGAHAPSLHRLMRTLASLGVLIEDDEHRFALTDLGQALRTGAPGSARSGVLTLGGQAFWRTWEHFLYCVQTGQPGWQEAWGVPMFEYLGRHPEEASLFSELMVGLHGNEPPAVAAAYDFSAFETVVDIGGATGNMLAAILARHPRCKGLLYDLPHVVRDAPALLEARGVAPRVRIEPGDFFRSVPAGGDAYILSHVIHDWNDERCLAILANCRSAMSARARLLIVEMVIPPGNAPHPAKLFDLSMMAVAGGQERTEEEYARLLDKGGFRLARIVPTESAVGVIEALVQ